jgi:hypothetical protein
VDGNYAFPTCVRCPTTLGIDARAASPHTGIARAASPHTGTASPHTGIARAAQTTGVFTHGREDTVGEPAHGIAETLGRLVQVRPIKTRLIGQVLPHLIHVFRARQDIPY